MKICEIKEKIRILKKTYKKIQTNFYPGILDDMLEADLFENAQALVFVIREPNRRRAFFAFADTDSLSRLLLQIPVGTVLEYIHNESINPLETLFINGGMEKYSSYIRITTYYSDSPQTVPATGKKKLLQQMYDPDCGEYAQEKDVAQLYKITKETFDPLCDEIFSVEEWRKIIDNKECILYREDEEIIAFYVYRLEGKKLYSNLSVNRGAANYLYNLERYIFEKMWDKGIRIFYSWVNEKNTKALRRKKDNIEKCIKSKQEIYNSIYIKK